MQLREYVSLLRHVLKLDWVLSKGISPWFGFRVWTTLWATAIEWIPRLHATRLRTAHLGFWSNLKLVLKKVSLLTDYKLLHIFPVARNSILWLFITAPCHGDEIVYHNITHPIESASCTSCICSHGSIGECHYHHCDIGLGMPIEACDNWMTGEEGICCPRCRKRRKYYFK